jgi:hypothetical protein
MEITTGKTCLNFLQAWKASADEAAEKNEIFFMYLRDNFKTINGPGEPRS